MPVCSYRQYISHVRALYNYIECIAVDEVMVLLKNTCERQLKACVYMLQNRQIVLLFNFFGGELSFGVGNPRVSRPLYQMQSLTCNSEKLKHIGHYWAKCTLFTARSNLRPILA